VLPCARAADTYPTETKAAVSALLVVVGEVSIRPLHQTARMLPEEPLSPVKCRDPHVASELAAAGLRYVADR
jgi:hypothetical protein